MLKAQTILRATAVIAVAVATFLLVPGSQAASFRTADEATSRALVNKARADVGLAPLADNAGLDQVARAQAVRMAQANQLFHNPQLRESVAAAGVKWEWLGENVASGFDPTSVHQDFMSSPEHHHNIVLPNYNAIGVGIVAGQGGTIWVAHVFAKVVTAAPVAAAPKIVSTRAPAKRAPVVVAATHEVAPKIKTVVAARTVSRPSTSPDTNALMHGVVKTESLG